jgi:hypothetical protein
MQRAFLLFLTILLFQDLGFPQSQVVNASACPIFSVAGPSDVVIPGSLINFKAYFKNFDTSKLKFEWTVTNGEIIKGQGTLSIDVKQIDCQKTTIATIRILELPETCEVLASGEVAISHCGTGNKLIDEYEKVTNNVDKRRLNKLVVELQNEPSALGFIIKSFARNVSKSKAYLNLQQILEYLEFSGIDKNRIIFGATYDSKEKTNLWLVPAGRDLPEFNDEVLNASKLAERVKTSKLKSKKRFVIKTSNRFGLKE